jgi:hypothetical protein
MASRMINQLVFTDDDDGYQDENERIRARRQAIADTRPVYGSEKHYSGSEERARKFNQIIREHYATKKLFQIDIESHFMLKEEIKSEAHYRGMLVELLVMNYLLEQDASNGFKNMPQFSAGIFDNRKDIIQGNRNIECKGETPVFIGNGLSFLIDQKNKVLNAHDLFVAVYGSKDGFENWACGYLWHFDMTAMPETEWLEYPAGPRGRAQHRFGHNMGTSMEDRTPYGVPVMKIPPKIYAELVGASGSQFEKVETFKETKKDYQGFNPMPWPVLVRNQRRRHNWDY